MASSEEQNLADLRKLRNFSQQELGLRVAKELRLKWKESAAQKRVSNWESGVSSPDPTERRALAKVLGVGIQQLDTALVQRQKTSGTQAFFEKLAGGPPSFVGICFTARPIGHNDSAILTAMQKGVASGNISFAMFVPGSDVGLSPPTENEDPAVSDDRAILTGYIKNVWKEVHSYCKAIVHGAAGKNLADHLKMYKPAADTNGSPSPFPPGGSRYCLIVQAPEGQAYKRELYLWVHTERFNDLDLVDTTEDGFQLEIWERYFSAVLTSWINKKKLPADGGFWKAVDYREEQS